MHFCATFQQQMLSLLERKQYMCIHVSEIKLHFMLSLHGKYYGLNLQRIKMIHILQYRLVQEQNN